MKLIHLSDLHLGKWVNGFSMLEDQDYILREILRVIDQEAPDGVIIAGDVYDRSVPPAEAVELFDGFLVSLARRGLQVFVISGNHDSPERIAFGGRLMDASGVHLSPVYNGRVEPVEMKDAFGPVKIWLLPFLRPADVRRFFEDREISSWTEAVSAAVGAMNVNPEERNVLVTHQFVTGAEASGSEDAAVGGTDNVDASVFAPFDYVALGHLHGGQRVGEERIRYCGTPLKYSFSEKDHQKGVTVVELAEKGTLAVRTVPLKPKRDLREIRGTYDRLMLKTSWEGTAREDYLRIVLTDEEDVPDAVNRLRVVYPNLMRLDYDNTRTRTASVVTGPGEERGKTEMELLAELYEKQNGREMSGEQRAFAEALLEKIREEMA